MNPEFEWERDPYAADEFDDLYGDIVEKFDEDIRSEQFNHDAQGDAEVEQYEAPPEDQYGDAEFQHHEKDRNDYEGKGEGDGEGDDNGDGNSEGEGKDNGKDKGDGDADSGDGDGDDDGDGAEGEDEDDGEGDEPEDSDGDEGDEGDESDEDDSDGEEGEDENDSDSDEENESDEQDEPLPIFFDADNQPVMEGDQCLVIDDAAGRLVEGETVTAVDGAHSERTKQRHPGLVGAGVNDRSDWLWKGEPCYTVSKGSRIYEIQKIQPESEDDTNEQPKMTQQQEKRFDGIFERLLKKTEATFGETLDNLFVGEKVKGDYMGEEVARVIEVESNGVNYVITVAASRKSG